MEEFAKVLIVAIIVERFTEWIKTIFGDALPDKIAHVSISMILAFIISLAIVYSTGIEVFSKVGIQFNNYAIDLLLTSWLISGGSNYIFDILKQVRNPIPKEIEVEVK